MLTHTLNGNLTFAQATGHAFMRNGYTMFPRRRCINQHKSVWIYNTAERNMAENTIKSASILSDDEIDKLQLKAYFNVYHPMLWHMILDWLQHLPNQERFRHATYLQPQVLANYFYWLTIKHTMLN